VFGGIAVSGSASGASILVSTGDSGVPSDAVFTAGRFGTGSVVRSVVDSTDASMGGASVGTVGTGSTKTGTNATEGAAGTVGTVVAGNAAGRAGTTDAAQGEALDGPAR
jgi:hypothetical protein